MYIVVRIQCAESHSHVNADVLPTPSTPQNISQILFSSELVGLHALPWGHRWHQRWLSVIGIFKTEEVALSSSPKRPCLLPSHRRCGGDPPTKKGVWILVSQREGHIAQPKIISSRWLKDTVLPSFPPKLNLSPSCFLHPMSGEGFGIKNGPPCYNYSRMPTNRSSLMNDLFF